MNEICRRYGIKKIQTTSWRPNCNGRIEVVHKQMHQLIAKHIDANLRDWDELMDCLILAYNRAKHASTRFSPQELFYGRQALMPVDLKLRQNVVDSDEKDLSESEYMDKFTKHLQAVFNEARTNSLKSALHRQEKYDTRVKPRQFEVGEKVLLKIEQFQTSCHRKWSKKYAGIYLVSKRLNEVNYVICKPNGSKSMVVHVDRLKKYW